MDHSFSLHLFSIGFFSLLVPGTKLLNFTWYNTVELYLVQNYYTVPDTKSPVCAWHKSIILCQAQ
jgi:hypothetical protein